MDNSEIGKNGDGFIDRSKVRILLCDNDEKSSQEVITLLCKCSYQVTPVKSPRQVIDALNAEGPDIDIILSEVDLPMSKGLKLLKYITRDKDLRRIPVIMMSAQDEVSVVVKCLKFGAADYLVKPLRTNELLNLWTHMWRRRRMLGLAEKNIVQYDVDLVVVSDHSDANTNSTTLFSDETDEKCQKSTNPDRCTSKHQENDTNTTTAAPIEIDFGTPSGFQPSGRNNTRTDSGPISPFQKKSELKMGESSAFFMYVKSSTLKSNNPVSSSIQEHTPKHLKIIDNLTVTSSQVGINIQEQGKSESLENNSPAYNHPTSNTIHVSLSQSQQRTLKEHESPNNVPDFYPCMNYPYYMSGMSQVQIQYHKNLPNTQNPVNLTMLPRYNHFPHCHPAMTPYPYYPPYGMCLQPGQMPTWQAIEGPSERKLTKVDRREAALLKFRKRRKERCFDKKIRYMNRKKLAERRPRVRGQFVRKVNGVNVDLNGQPGDEEYEEDEEDYVEEDQSGNIGFSVDDGSFCRR